MNSSRLTFVDTATRRGDAGRFSPCFASDADWDNRIGYPAFVVEPGAKLVFTDNDRYPKALIWQP